MRRLSNKVYALVDSERGSAAIKAIPERLQFERNCTRVGIKCHLTELRATESYFTDAAIKSTIGNSYAQVGDFEKAPDNWPKHENWRIADKMELKHFRKPDIVHFLRDVAAG